MEATISTMLLVVNKIDGVFNGGCLIAWFEELRKRRVAELRQELEKSEGSIGLKALECWEETRSLESKLESLKAETGNCGHADYGSSRTASPVPVLKSEGVESSGKDTSKDGLSAGSFTQDIRTNWFPGSHIPASVAEMNTRPEIYECLEQEKISGIKNLAENSNELGVTLQKRRGKRKRKDYNREPKEWSNGESENLGSTNVVSSTSTCKKNSTSDCGPTVRSSSINDYDRGSSRVENDDLMDLFNSLAENDNALVFRHRLDSQKRARYKKTIRRHMDFDTIRARISSCSTVSVKELFRDLLLLANNATVFYSKRTREHKTALLLRDIITKAYKQHCGDSQPQAACPIFPLSPMCNPPVKPRSTRRHNRKLSAKPPAAENVIDGIPRTPKGWKKPNNVENVVGGMPDKCKNRSNSEIVISRSSMESLMVGKKGFSWLGMFGSIPSNQLLEAPMKERKRGKRK
ncbi:hypothetical protein U1Q18_047189 [Sarracenia purpurea var. burkii]